MWAQMLIEAVYMSGNRSVATEKSLKIVVKWVSAYGEPATES